MQTRTKHQLQMRLMGIRLVLQISGHKPKYLTNSKFLKFENFWANFKFLKFVQQFVKTIHSKHQMWTSCGARGKLRGITKLITNYSLVTMNVCTKFHGHTASMAKKNTVALNKQSQLHESSLNLLHSNQGTSNKWTKLLKGQSKIWTVSEI